MTLKELWEQKGLSSVQVAGLADVSTTTLYKIHRKESVNSRKLMNVLKALNISREEYNKLEAGSGAKENK